MTNVTNVTRCDLHCTSRSLLRPTGMTMGGPTGGEMIVTMLELLWVAEELCSLLDTELREA